MNEQAMLEITLNMEASEFRSHVKSLNPIQRKTLYVWYLTRFAIIDGRYNELQTRLKAAGLE